MFMPIVRQGSAGGVAFSALLNMAGPTLIGTITAQNGIGFNYT
jgi:hypothetical protein